MQCSGEFCGESSARGLTGGTRFVEFLNRCDFGTVQVASTRTLSFSFDLQSDVAPTSNQKVSELSTAPFQSGIVFLDQGFCGPPEDLNCTAVEINLGETSSVRILPTPFSVPVSFGFSGGCSLAGECLDQTCPPQILECSARDASVVVTFCPTPEGLSQPPSTSRQLFSATSPIFTGKVPLLSSAWTSRPSGHLLVARASKKGKLLGAALGGTLGGLAFLLLVLAAITYYIRRRRARRFEARLPQPQVPFVVNPTWVLASPTTPEGSHLSLPDRARPRTVPVVAHQASMPNLSRAPTTQYRTRVLRPRASTVGTEASESREREQSEPVVRSRSARSQSESSVWRPRIDILGSRQRAEESSRGVEGSFWAV
ncbi:hypothetical protein C8R46DRAFT_1213522 [Mycena filopes]|nr:hypothetical protein C8R46DRAFT_1213522 [Mycena filopes]